MKTLNVTGMLTRACLLLLIAGAGTAPAGAQTDVAAEPFYERFDFGVRVGGLPLKMISADTTASVDIAQDPPLLTTHYSQNASQRFTAGPTMAIRMTDRFALNLDFLYKRLGYDSGIETGIDIDDPADNVIDFTESGRFERTRADVWDISVMGRRYNRPYFAYGLKTYVNAGVSIRAVTGVKSFREIVNFDANNDTNNIPVNPTRRYTPGVIAGAGLQAEDEIGIKLEFEARYTRWLQRAFDNGAIRTNSNQVEVMVGFTF